MTFDPMFVNKHELTYTHMYIKGFFNLLDTLQILIFHVDKCVIQEMKRLTTFVSCKLLVPRLKTCYHSKS
jgi:hypothetical protein